MGSHRCRLPGVLSLALLALLAGCAHRAADAPPLYDRLGGVEGIAAVVDTFLGHVAADARIAGRFAETDMERLRTQLVDQLCELSGGPCRYQGLEMRVAHSGLGITDRELAAMLEDLERALVDHGIEPAARRQVVRALRSMRGEVVGL